MFDLDPDKMQAILDDFEEVIDRHASQDDKQSIQEIMTALGAVAGNCLAHVDMNGCPHCATRMAGMWLEAFNTYRQAMRYNMRAEDLDDAADEVMGSAEDGGTMH